MRRFLAAGNGMVKRSTAPKREGNKPYALIDPATAASRRLGRRDAEWRGELLITVKVNVVDACFAGLDTIHYLLKVLIFNLQSINYQ